MKIIATIYKEFLLLIRDPGGMALLFIMPVALVIVMALIQDAPFRDYEEMKLDVLYVDQDHDSLGRKVIAAFDSSQSIHLLEMPDSSEVKALVQSGKFKAALFLPAGSTAALQARSRQLIHQVLFNAGLLKDEPDNKEVSRIPIRTMYDPAIKPNYRQVLSGSLEKLLTAIQASWIIEELQRQLGEGRKVMPPRVNLDFSGLVTVEQSYVSENRNPVGLNSVQHNVPAWTMFAMFFILFPLAGNYIKEREEGSMLRLRLIAGSQLPVVTGKFSFYFAVCLLQFILMMTVGIYVMPWFGLKSLVLGDNAAGIALTACAVAIAATGFGTLIAVYFKTPQQALSFGSISVVILSALGGVWVPVYVMPGILQSVSRFSPLNWGLESFNDLFLRGAETWAILNNLIKLTIFGGLTLALSVFIHKSRTVT